MCRACLSQSRVLQAAEYTAIREELYFLRPLKAKVAGVLFWLAILLWFQVSQQPHLQPSHEACHALLA
jgi:hypothetical protein